MARHARRETGERYLCLAGGVALNCVANGKLLRAGIFDDLWIQPAAGDSGGALGAALFAWHQVMKQPRPAIDARDGESASYLGPAFSNEDVVSRLDGLGAVYRRLPESEIFDEAARLLDEGKISAGSAAAWSSGRGRSETAPSSATLRIRPCNR